MGATKTIKELLAVKDMELQIFCWVMPSEVEDSQDDELQVLCKFNIQKGGRFRIFGEYSDTHKNGTIQKVWQEHGFEVETSSKAKNEIYKVLGDKFEAAKRTIKEYVFPGQGTTAKDETQIFDEDDLLLPEALYKRLPLDKESLDEFVELNTKIGAIESKSAKDRCL